MINKNENLKKFKKLKFRWLKQRIEIFIKRIKYNWQKSLFKIISLLFMAIGLITFNCNLDKIRLIRIISTPFQFTLSSLDISINLAYIVIYLLSVAIWVAIAKIMSKSPIYDEYNEYLGIIFTPTTKDEIQTIIAPEVIVAYPNPLNKNVTIIETFSNSIKEDKFRAEQENIHHYFGYYVKGFQPKGTDKMLIYLTKVKPFVEENSRYFETTDLITDDNDLKIVLGTNCYDELEIWNSSKNVHAKICGCTRSGKTYLQKLVNLQILLLGHKLYVYDGKKIDYTSIWKRLENCIILNTEYGLLLTLKLIDAEHERRTKLLNNKLDTIDKYNKANINDKRQHIFLVIEECADIFGKSFTNAEKDKKDIELEKNLNAETIFLIEKLVRKGGATGIHIILNSQKLTATMLPKQLPINITENWSAHVDTITSQIAVGNDDAHDLIPKDAKGVFVNEEHTLIKSFLINEELQLAPFDIGREIDGDAKVSNLMKDLEKFKSTYQEKD